SISVGRMSLRDEISREGQFMRRFHELSVLRRSTPSFTLTWTTMHAIDPASPLWGWTPEALDKANALLVVSLSGLDETVSLPIHARHSYTPGEILWHHQFVDLFYETTNGDRFINFSHFHDVKPLD
ncbi:Inward rectifier potassium channel, partial [Rubidibacter lacunae KORDI 51-2]